MPARNKAAILKKEYGIPNDTTRHIIQKAGQMGTFSQRLSRRTENRRVAR